MGNSSSKVCSVEEIIRGFFKDCVVVWYDPDVNSKKNQQKIVRLRRLCEVFTFTEWEKASNFIKEARAVCHVIAADTKHGQQLVNRVFEYDNVCDIYVLCRSKEAPVYVLWKSSNYSSRSKEDRSNISCVELNIQDIINQVQQNLFEWCKQASSLNLNLPTFGPALNESDQLRVINREQAKKDFLALSRAFYSDEKHLKAISSFEKYYQEYNRSQTLRWFTQEDSFLSKVTNNCLRISSSDSIQYGRLPLTDIEQAIKDHYKIKSRNYNGLLYKGIYLSQKRWSSLKENQDKEIEMHGFLSVSKEKNVALNFMKIDPSRKVLITIIVPKGPNQEEQGFAEIEEFSQRKEVLFNVRSRFTVLETEDLPYRHLVLLYGAQGFRKFMSERNPYKEISLASVDNTQKFSFVSIKTGVSYSTKNIDFDAAPFLCVSMMNKDKISRTTKVSGYLLMNANQRETPFYGYKCYSCQAKRRQTYLVCTDCGAQEKKWCENCFEKETPFCVTERHNIILETSPFSFWCEKMSRNEFNHQSEFQFQNNLIEKVPQSDENQKAVVKDDSKPRDIENWEDFFSLLVGDDEIIIKCSVEKMMKVFFQEYVILWHDPDSNNQENQQYIAQIKKFCEVFIFSEWEKVKDYIQNTQAVCHVITSGTNGELLVKEILGYQSVCNIYVFCANKEYHSHWAQNYHKILCVETDIQNLLCQIQHHLLEWYKKASSLNYNLPAFAPIFNDSDKSEMNNLHRYLKMLPNFARRRQASQS